MLLSVFKNSVSRNAGEPNLRCLATPRVFLLDSLFREVVCEASFAKLVSRDTAFETFEKKNLRWHSHFYRTAGSFYSRIDLFTVRTTYDQNLAPSLTHSLTDRLITHSLCFSQAIFFPLSHNFTLFPSRTPLLSLYLSPSLTQSLPLLLSLSFSLFISFNTVNDGI
jgi:hypothetical protein